MVPISGFYPWQSGYLDAIGFGPALQTELPLCFGLIVPRVLGRSNRSSVSELAGMDVELGRIHDL